MQPLRFQQHSHLRPPTSIPLISSSHLLKYFSAAELQPRIRLNLDLINNLRRAISLSCQDNLYGYSLFYDEFIDIDKPQHLWKYYMAKMSVKKDNLQGLVEITCNILNYVRMVVQQAKKAMDSYVDEGEDSEYSMIVRSLLEVEVDTTKLQEIFDNRLSVKGFSKVVHYKLEQKGDELIIFVGFSDKAEQFIYLLLAFREANMKRLKIQNPKTSLAYLDSIVEHLILVMRRIAGEKDFNLFGNGIKAVIETYIWPTVNHQAVSGPQLLKIFKENQRLLLLYECNYAYVHIFNTTSRASLEQTLNSPLHLSQYLFEIITNCRGLLLKDQDISYCCSSFLRNQTELTTIMACQKKTPGNMVFWSAQSMIDQVINNLVGFFDKKLLSHDLSNNGTLNQSIRSTLRLLNTSRQLVKSRLQIHGQHLIAVPINFRLHNDHFGKHFQRLTKILKKERFDTTQVEKLISEIITLHSQKMEIMKSKSRPRKNRLSSRTDEQKLKLVLGKTLKMVSNSSDYICHLIETMKERSRLLIPFLTIYNPYSSDSLHFKIIQNLTHKCLKRNYQTYIKAGWLGPIRQDALYQYLSQIFIKRKIEFDIGRISLEEEMVNLLTQSTSDNEYHVINLTGNKHYQSMLDKLSSKICAELPDNPDGEFIQTIFKYLEQEMETVANQDTKYTFLGSLYFQTVFGWLLQNMQEQVKLNNSPYKAKSASQLTSEIKKTKILELVRVGGLSPLIYELKVFFRQMKASKNPLHTPGYQIYRDFFADNYAARLLTKQLQKGTGNLTLTTTLSQSLLALDDQLEDWLEDQRAHTVFSLFDRDVEQFQMPQPTPDQINHSLNGSARVSKQLQLSKTFEDSKLIKDLFNINPNARIAGYDIKQAFQRKSSQKNVQNMDKIRLYHKQTVVNKVFGMSLYQADQLLKLFQSLTIKAEKLYDLPEDERSHFNQCMSRVLAQQEGLKRCMTITTELERYLVQLQHSFY